MLLAEADNAEADNAKADNAEADNAEADNGDAALGGSERGAAEIDLTSGCGRTTSRSLGSLERMIPGRRAG